MGVWPPLLIPNFAAVQESSIYELVVGLEVHAQLLTRTKLFCSDPTDYGADPNTQVSAISLAHPGTLPAMNEAAIGLAIKLGLALDSEIVKRNYFARKNYFYPDLPKGYQVSQHTAPICLGGSIGIMNGLERKQVILNRIHIEEDAGKSLHDQDPLFTCIDLNRAGVPLLEIVTEPCIHCAEDAFSFLTELRKILRWTGVCDGNMEEGSMRCDANISIRKKGDTQLGKRVEVKNLNSIRNVKKAIEIEFNRLVQLSEEGKPITQETRSFDANNLTTFSLRSKEEAEDYRYFPEPDLPLFAISDEWIAEIKNQMPELPETLSRRLQHEFGLSSYDSAFITAEKEIAAYFEALVKAGAQPKAAANWISGPVKAYLNQEGIGILQFPLTPICLTELILLVESGKLSFSIASGKLMPELIAQPQASATTLASDMKLFQTNNEADIRKWVDEVLQKFPEKVAEFKKGKRGLAGMFAGEVKKLSKGKADMELTNSILLEQLNK